MNNPQTIESEKRALRASTARLCNILGRVLAYGVLALALTATLGAFWAKPEPVASARTATHKAVTHKASEPRVEYLVLTAKPEPRRRRAKRRPVAARAACACETVAKTAGK